MKNAGRKLSASNYRALTARESWRKMDDKAASDVQEAEFAVIPRDAALDDEHSPFFLTPDATQILDADEMRALDAMLERHGLANLIETLRQLCESRVEEENLVNGRVLYHMSREDAWSHAAERLFNLKCDERVKAL